MSSLLELVSSWSGMLGLFVSLSSGDESNKDKAVNNLTFFMGEEGDCLSDGMIHSDLERYPLECGVGA
jgi:hypothetical protein